LKLRDEPFFVVVAGCSIDRVKNELPLPPFSITRYDDEKTELINASKCE
jgi:hypothetical protein